MEEAYCEFQVFPALSIAERALLRAQSGASGGVAFSAIPSSPLTRIDTPLFRVLLLRRLHLPLSPSSCFCRCGRPLDPPSCSLRPGWSVGEAWVRCGVCCSPDLPGGRRPRDPQCFHSRPGSGSSHRRCQSPGICRRWFAAPRWSATRHRHHAGVDVEVQRRTETPDGKLRRAVLEVARRQTERTYPELDAPVHSWWSLLARSQERGLLKPSRPSWRRQSLATSHVCCDDAQSTRGGCVGAPFSPAQQPGRSPLLSLVKKTVRTCDLPSSRLSWSIAAMALPSKPSIDDL